MSNIKIYLNSNTLLDDYILKAICNFLTLNGNLLR